ncbi:MAG: NDP-sugar synthase [bacterium]|nr:NDP-sugar synthase [bacterium]MDD5755690.1 NDP-sugar synthase [bacterium]
MKAMVMAAGVGTRLRPLTHFIPKPMIPIVNKPALEHTLELLKKHNLDEVVINLHFYPDMIRDHFEDGRRYGLKIQYSQEKVLLGTAGGVKRAERYFQETFVVMSGDGLTDINLSKVIEFHKKKKSLATMVLKKVDARFDYGVTLIDQYNRIEKFIEKPAWSDVFANTVNTGIYVFEPEIFDYIPKNKFYDFGRNVWPLLLAGKKPIFGYEMNSYWCDIGNLQEYKRAEKNALEGAVKIKIPGKLKSKNIWIGSNTYIHPGVKIAGPVVIGSNCRIEKGVTVDSFTTIGNNSIIEEKAVLSDCILWAGVHVARGVQLRNCVIGNQATISENISVFEGSVINIDEKK